MKLLFFFLFTFSLSCETPGKSSEDTKTFSSFEAVPLGASSIVLEKVWNKPQEKEDYDIEGVHFTRWQYIYSDSKRSEAWFLIDQSKGGIIVEKVFLPLPHSRESDFQYLIGEKFKDVKFEKIGTKCSHFGEIVYFNKTLGLFIISRDPVTAIASDTQELVNLRNKEEQNRRCSWH